MVQNGLRALLHVPPNAWRVLFPADSAMCRASRGVSTISTAAAQSSWPRPRTSPLSTVYPSSVHRLSSKLRMADQLVSHVSRYSSYVSHDVGVGTHIKVESLSKNDLRRVVTVRWSDGEEQDYPFIWLLDNCRCSDCYHVGSQSRLLSFVDLDTTACPESMETTNHGKALRVSWNRHHHSDFNFDWLRTFRFDKAPRDEIISPVPKLWGSEIAEILPEFKFQDVVSDDEVLFDFLKAFGEFGIVKIQGAPAKPKQIPIIAGRVGLMRDTSFGLLQPLKNGGNEDEDYELDRNISYTSKGLQLHNDMSSLSETTCMAFFHCIKPSEDENGYSMYSDGFKAADILRRVDPGAFRELCTNQPEFRLTGAEPHVGEFDHRCYHSLITLDHFGELKAICYSNHARRPLLRMPVDDVQSMYSALQAFVKLIESPQNVFYSKLKRGEMMVLNNHRVLHGRTPFSDSSERHLELGYVDWDHVTSRMRVLQSKFNGGGI